MTTREECMRLLGQFVSEYDFLKTPAGVDALDIAAVRLMAVGE